MTHHGSKSWSFPAIHRELHGSPVVQLCLVGASSIFLREKRADTCDCNPGGAPQQQKYHSTYEKIEKIATRVLEMVLSDGGTTSFLWSDSRIDGDLRGVAEISLSQTPY